MSWRPRSVRVRLTLWFGAVLALVVLIFSVSIFCFVQARLRRQLNRQLSRDLATVSTALREGEEDAAEVEDYGVVFARVSEGDRIIFRTKEWQRAALDKAVKTPGGNKKPDTAKPPAAATPAVPAAPKAESQPPTAGGAVQEGEEREDHNRERREETELKSGRPWTWTREHHAYRLLTGKRSSKGHTYQIAVAQDERPLRQSLRTLALILLLAFPATLCLAMFGGYFLAGRLLAPVGAMASKARDITAERLSERLPVADPDDEFGRLATVFNQTLSRLEASFERLRRFTADASHELRTPLTAIRSVGEVALQDELDAAAGRDVIGSMLEEADRLARLVDSLLVLTRADSGQVHPVRTPLDPAALVRDVAECLGVLAEEKSQTLSVEIEDPPTVAADRATLRLALINILDNAIKYTPPQGRIHVAAKRRGDEALIEIRDSGPGIAAEHREKIFERFFRAEDARARETGGAGLGLAIARWAVELNGGRIELESEEGRGSTFRVVLPELEGGGAEPKIG